MQETMTNITGQVRQRREEMEAIRSRPTHFTGLPINESREWLNFRQYKRKPMEFLARIEEYFAKHKITQWSHSREILDESFREITDNWWMANRSEIPDYQQFRKMFKSKYWSETTQNLIRDNICNGRYRAQLGSSMTAYFLGKVCMAKHLEPAIPEECLVNKISYHYDEDIVRARRGSQIKTIQAMTELLEGYENEEYYRQSRRRNERPEARPNQYPNNGNNHPGNRNQPSNYDGPNNPPRNNNFNGNANGIRNNNPYPNNRNNYYQPNNSPYSQRNPYPSNNGDRPYPPNRNYYNNNYSNNNSNNNNNRVSRPRAVSYTHLDVYKRQLLIQYEIINNKYN